MSAFAEIERAALCATRELMMAVEFAEQARDAIESGAFHPACDTEIDSAESCLITVRGLVLQIEETLTAMKSGVPA